VTTNRRDPDDDVNVRFQQVHARLEHLVEVHPGSRRRWQRDPESTQLNTKDAGLALLAVEHLQLGKVLTESSVLTSAGILSALLYAAQSLMKEYPYALNEMLCIVINMLLLHEMVRSAYNSIKGCQQRRDICFSAFIFLF
jgi:hypothetical protein